MEETFLQTHDGDIGQADLVRRLDRDARLARIVGAHGDGRYW